MITESTSRALAALAIASAALCDTDQIGRISIPLSRTACNTVFRVWTPCSLGAWGVFPGKQAGPFFYVNAIERRLSLAFYAGDGFLHQTWALITQCQ